MSSNLSLYSIPAYYTLALVPHIYSVVLLGRNEKKWDNASPRSEKFSQSLRKDVPPKMYAQYERCRAAHGNMLENSGFFIGAVLAGVLAELHAGYMNRMIGWYLGSRIVYLICYISIERQRYAYIRTAAFNLGFLILVLLYFKAAGVVYAKSAL